MRALTLVRLLLAIVPAVLGCAGKPEDAFHVRGRVVTSEGVPVAESLVTFLIIPREDGECRRFPPLEDVGAPSGSPRQTQRTTPEGEFDFLAYRFQANDQCALFVGDGLEGVPSEIAIDFPTAHLVLPDLVLWQGSLSLTRDATGTTVSPPSTAWVGLVRPGDRLPALSSRPSFLTWHFRNASPDGPFLWKRWTGEESLPLDPAWTEDVEQVSLQPEVLTIGSVIGELSIFGGQSEFFYVRKAPGPAIAIPSTAVIPVSRGASCRSGSGPMTPCGLTDGREEQIALADGPDRQSPADAELELFALELPRSVAIDRIVLRRLVQRSWFKLRVEGSNDGIAWTTMGEVAPDETEALPAFLGGNVRYVELEIPPDAGAVRQLRVMTRRQADEPSTLADVAVFERVTP